MTEKGDRSNPDQYVSKDVSELRTDFGRLDERINSLEKVMATKEDLANWRATSLSTIIYIIVPILSAALGALAITWSSKL